MVKASVAYQKAVRSRRLVTTCPKGYHSAGSDPLMSLWPA